MSQQSTLAETGLSLTITRDFDAPRDLVFKAWTDPEMAMHWMGPRPYPATSVEMDAQPGGAWRIGLASTADGRQLWQSGVVREIVPPERLVFTFAWDDEDGRPGREMLISLHFADHQGKTRMTFHQSVFESVEDRDGHNEGWNSAFDRLAEALAAA